MPDIIHRKRFSPARLIAGALGALALALQALMPLGAAMASINGPGSQGSFIGEICTTGGVVYSHPGNGDNGSGTSSWDCPVCQLQTSLDVPGPLAPVSAGMAGGDMVCQLPWQGIAIFARTPGADPARAPPLS